MDVTKLIQQRIWINKHALLIEEIWKIAGREIEHRHRKGQKREGEKEGKKEKLGPTRIYTLLTT